MSNEFLSGSYQFNNSPLYNFQLNRVVLWNHGDLAEVAARGKEITDFASWERVLKELSYQAERRKDWAAAAGYLRMAEFFMVPDTPESRDVYDRAQELFYANFAHLFSPQGGPIHRDEVPYESGTLPCWRITPSGDKRGTILFHGGNDSLLEEFTDLLLYLARGGYEILAFEGPGQGGCTAEVRFDFYAGVGEAGGRGIGLLRCGGCHHCGRLPGRRTRHAGGCYGTAYPESCCLVRPAQHLWSADGGQAGRNPYNTGTVAV